MMEIQVKRVASKVQAQFVIVKKVFRETIVNHALFLDYFQLSGCLLLQSRNWKDLSTFTTLGEIHITKSLSVMFIFCRYLDNNNISQIMFNDSLTNLEQL